MVLVNVCLSPTDKGTLTGMAAPFDIAIVAERQEGIGWHFILIAKLKE